MEFIKLSEKYSQDLIEFLNCAESKRGTSNDKKYPEESIHLDFYLNHSKEELNDFINLYLTNNKVTNDYEFCYMLKCIIKYMSAFSDSHTIIDLKDNIWFPIKFKIINNNVFVDRCYNENLLRKKIKKINGVDIAQIMSEIEACTSYAANGWLLSETERSLANKNRLLILPSISPECEKIKYEIEDGEIISFDINEKHVNCKLYPPKDHEQYKIIDDILVFKYPSCINEYAPDLNKIDTILKNNNIQKFVLDLRGNSGGDSTIINELIKYLENSNLSLYTIVDRTVFSSARFAVIDMKRIGSKIIGEDIGTPINCFGYGSNNFLTTNCQMNYRFSKVYWYEKNGYMRGIYTKEELNRQTKDFFEPKYLELDIRIELSEDEYTSTLDDIFLQNSIETIKKENTRKL